MAQNVCEYCLLNEQWASRAHEPDHIIAEKHGGETTIANLCLSCFDCNRHKGSDLCSLDLETGELVPLFHPRNHKWETHFQLHSTIIVARTPIGRVTVRLLDINDTDRVEERDMLLGAGEYPGRPIDMNPL